MVRIFLDSPARNALIALGTAIFVVAPLTAFGQIKLNAWNKAFYDALSLKDFIGFMHQLVIFAVLAGFLLVPNVARLGSGR
jgi:vitamin B12/bleomycin/antimicrobial peptide transport system ATP-binding/permease protein